MRQGIKWDRKDDTVQFRAMKLMSLINELMCALFVSVRLAVKADMYM